MIEIHIDYQGDLRTHAVHGPSQTELITDAPVDNQGRGESFSPTDLVATALGTCMATIMGIVAKRKQIDLRGMTIRVEKHMSADPHAASCACLSPSKCHCPLITQIAPCWRPPPWAARSSIACIQTSTSR